MKYIVVVKDGEGPEVKVYSFNNNLVSHQDRGTQNELSFARFEWLKFPEVGGRLLFMLKSTNRIIRQQEILDVRVFCKLHLAYDCHLPYCPGRDVELQHSDIGL